MGGFVQVPFLIQGPGNDVNPGGKANLRVLCGNAAGLTAFAGGGQASATPLPSEFNVVAPSVATTPPFDSVLLPASVPGLDVVVVNSTANPIQVYGSGTDTINGVAAATGIT